jgi:steroid 5-alpha reductase family enzyme
MVALWLLSLRLRDASIVDIFWGTGFAITSWYYALAAPDPDPTRRALIVSLTTLWGLRLSLHIARRNVGKGEDYRYRQWREEEGQSWWWKSFLRVFLLQGALMWITSAPLLAANASVGGRGLNALDNLGVGVWLVGFIFEAVGDYQLSRFKADPANKGKLLTAGLWRYTRHPNYFGDATQWWGFYLVALAAGGWYTIFSPLLITFLLVRVSGVAMLERALEKTKPGYREYVRRTNAFFPWFPRKA